VRVAARLLLLAGLRLLPPRGRARPRSGFDGRAEFGVFDQVSAGVVGDFAHHRLVADPAMDVFVIGVRLKDASQIYENTRVAGIKEGQLRRRSGADTVVRPSRLRVRQNVR
jgi:hypothetical protein